MPILKKYILTNNPLNKSNILLRAIQKSENIFSRYFWKFADILACNNRKIAEFYEKKIGFQYRREYEAFGLMKYSRILHIGCGAYPLSEIILSESSTLKIVGIDKNPKAIDAAIKIIQKKNLEKRVKIIKGDGINYKVKDFDVIIVSSCSTPKEKILDNVFKNVNKNIIIIVREINSNKNNILDYIGKQNYVKVEKKLQFFTIFLIPFSWIAFYLVKMRES